MALISSTGSSVVLDETAGLQNATASAGVTGDSDDNDILLTSLLFATAYAVLSSYGPVTNTALSGYTGAAGNTGSDAFTVTAGTGGAITDVSFVGSDGKPLAGVDSGLLTLDGTKIFLYNDPSNNNVVLGRVGFANGTADPANDTANPNGVIAFAGYIQETLTSGAITGGRIWLTEYQPLRHPDPTKADEPIDLNGKVFVGVSQDANFSLAGAPSGQQLFLMFTTEGATADASGRIPGVSIIVTGKDPLDQSASGAAITSADTVNSSQGGGNTTLGTNNQAITEGEGLRFSFVTGARADVTIPNLDPGEAGVEANIDFTQYFGARSATFQVVQETGGTTAMIRLTAFRNADNVAGSQSGVNFVNSYADDATERVAITVSSISVKTFAGAAVSGVTVVDNGDGSVTIKGVPTDSQITYLTATDHNRVMIENAGSLTAKNGDKTHADFDIGGFKVLQTSVDKVEIGSRMVFEDDGPTLSTTGTEPTLTVDETFLTTDATQSFAANFASAFGADGAGTLVYTLGVVAGASGLTDTATNEAVNLSITAGGVVQGRTATTGLLVFEVTVDSAGSVKLDQQRAVVHSPNTGADQSTTLSADTLVTLTATTTDKDGDSVHATLNIGSNLVFKDDAPTISTTGTEPTLTVDETFLTTDATQSFAANFASAFGADGAGTLTYALGVVAGPSGLTDTATGEAVNLSITAGGVVQGRTATTGLLVFEVSVNSAGSVTLDQQRAVVHSPNTGPDQSTSLSSDTLVTLTATITDKDGDSNQATLNIGSNLVFKDDAPTISTTGTEPTLTVDETVLATDATASFAANFTSAFGADGAGTLTYALGVVAGASGLLDSGTGEAVNLSVTAGGVVQGRTATTGLVVFEVSVDSGGSVTLDQKRAVLHSPNTGPDQSTTLSSDALVTLTATKTDKDGDSTPATLNIGQNLVFKDDAPSIAFGNLVGTGTDLAQFGFWSKAPGADGPNADDLQIALTGFQLGGVAQAAANFSLTEGSPSPDGSGNYRWTGSLTGDFDGNGTVDANPLTFSLVANPTTGRYALDLAAPVTSSTTTDTANGALGAGGPDAVQTLSIPATPSGPAETVVFFSAKIAASAADIAAGVITGATDPTEASLQGNNPPTTLASFIDPRSMNVSTAGIGVDNNNMNGYGASGNNAIIDDPAGNEPSDDSFVVNPLGLVDKVRVFIDNSVTGYDYTGGERLQYRIVYANGSTSNYQTVVGDLGKGALPKYFEIDGAGQKIDAVQLTMLYGEIKIPNIQFVTVTESLAKDIGLDFTASITDKDGDTASSNFSADLFTNKASTATFDYELIGTTNAPDTFDVDLQTTRNDYRIAGFDTTAGARDRIVLIGDAGATVSNIDNSGADSIVTITEAGLQVTTVVVVGVDLLSGDILLG